jgi:nucleotide-binding universal stress UspA family protein
MSRWGHPIEEILNVAGEVRADLIIMGAHSHSNLHGLLLSSVAEGVVKRSPDPVLIARPSLGKVDRVVIGYDGSLAARKAVRFVGRLANPESSEFTLVNAIPPFVMPAGTPLPYRAMASQQAHAINKQREHHAKRRIAAAVALLAKSGRHVAARVARNDPAQALVDVSGTENADLVVVGSDGPGNTGQSYRVAKTLVRHSRTSILIVR